MINTSLHFLFSNTHYLHKVLKSKGITSYSFVNVHGKIAINFHGGDEQSLFAVLQGLCDESICAEVQHAKDDFMEKSLHYYSHKNK